VLQSFDVAMQETNSNHHFLKTAVCRYFSNKTCKKGTMCPFAHSSTELQPLPDLRKTALCRDWKQGCCRLSGENCPFAHGKHELRTSKAFKQQLMAKKLKPPSFSSSIAEQKLHSLPGAELTWDVASSTKSHSSPSVTSSARLDEVQQLEDKLMGDASIGDAQGLGGITEQTKLQTKGHRSQIPRPAEDVLEVIVHVWTVYPSATAVEHALVAAMPHHYED